MGIFQKTTANHFCKDNYLTLFITKQQISFAILTPKVTTMHIEKFANHKRDTASFTRKNSYKREKISQLITIANSHC